MNNSLLSQLSDEQLDAMLLYSARQSPASAGGEGLLGNVFAEPAVQPTGEEGFSEGAATALANIPHSLANRGRELEQVVTHPLETLRGIGRLGLGAGDLLAEQFGAEPTENSNLVRQAGQSFKEGFTKENMLADPTRPIADVASLIVPFAPKGSSLLGRVGRAAQMAADPIGEAALPIARKGAQVARDVGSRSARIIGDAAAEGLGFSTGKQAPRIREAWRAGREGELRDFMQSIRDQESKKAIGREVIDALKEEERRLGKTKGAFVDANAETLVDATGLMDEVVAALAQQDITVTGRRDRLELVFPKKIDARAAAPIEEAVDLIADLPARAPLKEMDDVKQRISQLFRQGRQSGVATTQLNNALRKRLDAVPGYSEANADFARIKDFMGELEDELNIRTSTPKRPQGKPKQAGRGIERAITEGAEDDLALLQRIEQVTGIPVRAKAAGQGLSQNLPGGLVARSVGAGAIGGAAAGFVPLATLPLFSPRLVGSLTALTGAGARQAEQIIGRLRKAAERLPDIGAIRSTITVGQLVERLQGQEDRPDSLLSTLGRAAGRGN